MSNCKKNLIVNVYTYIHNTIIPRYNFSIKSLKKRLNNWFLS